MVDTACEDACLPDQPEDGLQMTLTVLWRADRDWNCARRRAIASYARIAAIIPPIPNS